MLFETLLSKLLSIVFKNTKFCCDLRGIPCRNSNEAHKKVRSEPTKTKKSIQDEPTKKGKKKNCQKALGAPVFFFFFSPTLLSLNPILRALFSPSTTINTHLLRGKNVHNSLSTLLLDSRIVKRCRGPSALDFTLIELDSFKYSLRITGPPSHS